MRRNFHILIGALVCLWFLHGDAGAAELLMGIVQTVERAKGAITVRVLDASGGGRPLPSGVLTVVMDADHWPAGLTTGDIVRVWGDFDQPGADFMRAETIRVASGRGGRRDPTGVRSRLGRGGAGGRMGGPGAGRR